MNFVDAQNLAILVDRYNELKSNKAQMEHDVKELLKNSDCKRQYSVIIMTNDYNFSYDYTNESVIPFMGKLIDDTDKEMENLLKRIREY